MLASAIDETIKSIEEYKEEVGIETKKDIKVTEFTEETSMKSYQERYSKQTVTEAKANGFEESKTAIEEIVEKCETATDNTEKAIITEAETIGKKETDIQNQSSEIESVKEIVVKIEPQKIIEERVEVKRTTNTAEVKENGINNSGISLECTDVSQNNVTENKEEVIEGKLVEENNKDPMAGFRPVMFDPESIQKRSVPHCRMQVSIVFTNYILNLNS